MFYERAYGIKLFAVKHLYFEPTKEILHSTIIHAVSFSGHTLDYVVLMQQTLVFSVLVLPALV